MAHVCELQVLEQDHCEAEFPMASVGEILDRFKALALYSAVDSADTFLQIPIRPHDGHRAAFHTRTRKRNYNCMPFGLVTAPAGLHPHVNHYLLGPIKEGWRVIYMDDVLVFSHTVQGHLQHCKKALQVLSKKQ